MQLAPLTPRPAPHPTWTGVAIGTVPLWNNAMGYHSPLVSTGAVGRAEGYDALANAMRAARQLSRGEEQGAVTVIERDARWYVQGVVAQLDMLSGGGSRRLHFEAALPARVGYATLRETAVVSSAMSGVVALVDGSRSLRVR